MRGLGTAVGSLLSRLGPKRDLVHRMERSMSEPKLHHFVPRFYLDRFAGPSGRFWVWDRVRDAVFAGSAASVAAGTQFYRHEELEAHGQDALTMEKQLSQLEGDVAAITGRWLLQISTAAVGDQVGDPAMERDTVSLFLALQYLRTADSRDILGAIAADGGLELSSADLRAAHLELLWDEKTVDSLTTRISGMTWMYARNRSVRPLITSDNPVLFRTGDNRKWVKLGVMSEGTYLNYPLSPSVTLYAYPREGKWSSVQKFDGQVSPVELDDAMVLGDNQGQVFMSGRQVYSPINDFQWARDFAVTIGTDTYAPKDDELP